jgi:hypothetical protein
MCWNGQGTTILDFFRTLCLIVICFGGCLVYNSQLWIISCNVEIWLPHYDPKKIQKLCNLENQVSHFHQVLTNVIYKNYNILLDHGQVPSINVISSFGQSHPWCWFHPYGVTYICMINYIHAMSSTWEVFFSMSLMFVVLAMKWILWNFIHVIQFHRSCSHPPKWI